MDSLSSFGERDLAKLRSKFCADVLINDRVFLKPTTSLTIGYFYPKLAESEYVRTTLPAGCHGIGDVIDDLYQYAYQKVLRTRRFKPDVASAYAAEELLGHFPASIVEEIDGKYRQGDPWREPYRAYQKFLSFTKYVSAEAKHYKTETRDFSDSDLLSKIDEFAIAGDVQERVKKAWEDPFLKSGSFKEDEFRRARLNENQYICTRRLAEWIFWRKKYRDLVISDDPVSVPSGGMTVGVDFYLKPTCTACTVTTTPGQATTTGGATVTETSTVTSTTTVSTLVTNATTVGLQMQVVSNSSVSNLVFDSTRGLLNFTVSGPSGTHGFFDATIARKLLSGAPVVLIDGVQSPASVSEDANFWYVHVTYMHSQHRVTIGGSNTVPEFPSVPLVVIFVLLSIVILRRVERKDH